MDTNLVARFLWLTVYSPNLPQNPGRAPKTSIAILGGDDLNAKVKIILAHFYRVHNIRTNNNSGKHLLLIIFKVTSLEAVLPIFPKTELAAQ